MCGICGIVNIDKQRVDQNDLTSMLLTMKNRGPDDEGIYINNNVGLGFVRLSIIDLSNAGHQPMMANDMQTVIVFNGEIYNYIELRNELQSDYQFKTNTDTEVLLAAYLKWGEDCVNRLNGMWAFCIYNLVNNKIFISRDRFGIKPVYYFKDEKKFAFASDIPALLSLLKDISIGVDENTLNDYLKYNRLAHSESTFFSRIKKIQHGHNITLHDCDFKIFKWYDLEKSVHKIAPSHANFRELFIDSCKLQLRSDVPIGLCFSGGIDSSSVLGVLRKEFNLNLHSFSAVYGKDEIGDESKYINLFNHSDFKLHSVYPSYETLLEDLDDFVYTLVEPVPDASEYAEYKVMKSLKSECTVALSGQGGDECFGGYDYLWGYYLKELLSEKKFLSFFKQVKDYLILNKSLDFIQYLIFSLSSSNIKRYSIVLRKKYLSDSVLNTSDSFNIIDKFYSAKTLKSFLIKHFEYKFEHHLLWSDRSGMRFSVETRFPFLDHRIVESALAIPSSEKLKEGFSKQFLRDSLKEYLPTDIYRRVDKVGFETPLSSWIKNKKVYGLINDCFHSQKFIERDIFDYNRLQIMLDQHIQNKADHSSEIWKAFHLELWYNKFIEQSRERDNLCIKKTLPDYVIITSAKNEKEFISRTIKSVIEQSHLPLEWIIVDDGSSDGTYEEILKYTQTFNWIKVIKKNTADNVRSGGVKVVTNFYTGFGLLSKKEYYFLVKLDADIELPRNYFFEVASEFSRDETIGLCGGFIEEEGKRDYHLRGAFKAISKSCFNDIGGFRKIFNWDGVDELDALRKNWKTKVINLNVKHFRPTSSAYSPLQFSFRCGYEAFKHRENIILFSLRILRRIVYRPFILNSLTYFSGYVYAMIKKEKYCIEKELGDFINDFHIKRILKKVFLCR